MTRGLRGTLCHPCIIFSLVGSFEANDQSSDFVKSDLGPTQGLTQDSLLISILALTHYITKKRQWRPTPVLLPGKSHGWRSLVGCSLWGLKESDTTEQLHFHFSLSYTGEGNGNPLQCSCLENPRDGGAWWAAVCGFAQSQTRLK